MILIDLFCYLFFCVCGISQNMESTTLPLEIVVSWDIKLNQVIMILL